MEYINQLRSAWINRQYRMTYRAVITGLLAAGNTNTPDVVAKAHEITVASLTQFKQSEV